VAEKWSSPPSFLLGEFQQRIAAVRVLEALGFTFAGSDWHAPGAAAPSLVPGADAMHGVLMRRADALVGCLEGSDECAELKATVDAIEAYEFVRWPEGKIPGARGRSTTDEKGPSFAARGNIMRRYRRNGLTLCGAAFRETICMADDLAHMRNAPLSA
jgi:hypothetical protein